MSQLYNFEIKKATNDFAENAVKNVYKLRPGHYFKYHDGKLDIKKYYELNRYAK